MTCDYQAAVPLADAVCVCGGGGVSVSSLVIALLYSLCIHTIGYSWTVCLIELQSNS